MAQHDYSIANQSGAAFRSDLNNALSAIVSQNSGASAPSTTYAYMTWADTTNGVMKMRDGSNANWITLYQLDGEWTSIAFENGTAAAPSIYFKDSGTDTGFFSPGTDSVGITTGGTERLRFASTGALGLSGANYGNSGQLLTSNGSGSAPTWQDVSFSNVGDGTAAAPSIAFSADTNTGIYRPGADTFGISTGGSERVRVDSSGNVGIGATPSYKLDIQKSSNADARVKATSSGYALFDLDSAASDQSILRFLANGTESVRLLSPGNEGNGIFAICNGTGVVERFRIASDGYLTGNVNGLGNGRIPAMQYYRLNSAAAGSNVSTAQSVLGVGVTLVSSTVYEFEALYILTKTVSATSHNFGIGFGGTATLNNIAYVAHAGQATVALPDYDTSNFTLTSNTAANSTFITAIASATAYIGAIVRGTVSINAGGTFIPQYTLSTVLGSGTGYSTQPGSFFRIWPLGASGANTSIGTWA